MPAALRAGRLCRHLSRGGRGGRGCSPCKAHPGSPPLLVTLPQLLAALQLASKVPGVWVRAPVCPSHHLPAALATQNHPCVVSPGAGLRVSSECLLEYAAHSVLVWGAGMETGKLPGADKNALD